MEDLTPSRELTLTEASGILLQPGDTITGLDRLPLFREFEMLCAKTIDPNFNPANSTLTRNPLDANILPRNFYGNVSGIAVIMPTSEEAIAAVRERNSRQAPLPPEETLSVSLCIDLFRGRRLFGTITRHALYYLGVYRASYLGQVSRKLGPALDIRAMRELAAIENATSAERAREVARFALRHPFGGGLPGTRN